MSTQIPVVERPDSATHFECDGSRAPRIDVGTPFERRSTHHLVGATTQRCIYCKRTGAQIRQEAGL
jgi:hypothetical protein